MNDQFGQMNLGSDDDDDGFDMGMSRGFKAWFVFCAVVALLTMVGSVYVIYLLLDHFGVLMAGVSL